MARRSRVAVGAIVLWAALTLTVAAAPEKYEASLSAMPHSDATRASVKGRGSAAVVLDGNKLSITGKFAGLAGDATEAHLRLGAGIGVPGPAFLSLQVTQAQDGTITGNLTLNADQQVAVRKGRVYIQIHSKASPAGTLWGWILPERPDVAPNEPVPGHGFLPQLDVPR